MNETQRLPTSPKVGRPRRGTEAERAGALLNAATRMFLAEGFERTSIDKVAAEAGVSTRTIYERYRNKADLLTAVISRLVERDMCTLFACSELERRTLEGALTFIGQTVTRAFADPNTSALFRIVVAEAQHFPELAAQVRRVTRERFEPALAGYLRHQTDAGSLALQDPERAAALFMQLLCAELQDRCLFGPPSACPDLDLDGHVAAVVQLFLHGALPRGTRPSTGSPTP